MLYKEDRAFLIEKVGWCALTLLTFPLPPVLLRKTNHPKDHPQYYNLALYSVVSVIRVNKSWVHSLSLIFINQCIHYYYPFIFSSQPLLSPHADNGKAAKPV